MYVYLLHGRICYITVISSNHICLCKWKSGRCPQCQIWFFADSSGVASHLFISAEHLPCHVQRFLVTQPVTWARTVWLHSAALGPGHRRSGKKLLPSNARKDASIQQDEVGHLLRSLQNVGHLNMVEIHFEYGMLLKSYNWSKCSVESPTHSSACA